MANYGHIIFFSLIGGLFSLLVGALLVSRERTALALAKYATPFAAGALIGAVFFDLLSEGVEESPVRTLMVSTVVGIVLFYLMERFIHWFHHHHREDEGKHVSKHHDSSLPLIIAGDTVHNALDGVAIAASFLISVPTGIVTTIAVAAHEIPQEIGDFGLMLHKGLSRGRALLVNALSALATTVMAVLTFAIGSTEKLPMGILIGLSAGFLLYIAMSDIIPELHKHDKGGKFVDWQPLLLIGGIVTVLFAVQIAHKYIDAGHVHEETASEHAQHSTVGDHADNDHENHD
ncbi:ZIP family metal transporter [Candidatus Saccharibacteria bacterium]|nr:MAG: ZIP family metal transporter [Candidatus Saccharibacteria bacterium]